MKALHLFGLSLTVLALQTVPALAQDQYRVTFSGSCRTTDGSGKIVTRSLSNQDLVQPCANASGIKKKDLTLVYTIGAEPGVDTINIVNATNGAVVCPLYRLAFPTSIPSPDGLKSEQLVFIYNTLQSDPIGSALLTEKTILDRAGNTNRISVVGKFQLYNVPTDTSNLALCQGNLSTGSRFHLP